MLPARLRVKKAFFSSRSVGEKVFHSPHLMLRASINKEKEGKSCPSLFSFSISKKNVSLATKRNTVRRRGYAIVRGVVKKTKPCFICSFSFKKGSDKTPFAELQKEVLDLLKKAHVL